MCIRSEDAYLNYKDCILLFTLEDLSEWASVYVGWEFDVNDDEFKEKNFLGII